MDNQAGLIRIRKHTKPIFWNKKKKKYQLSFHIIPLDCYHLMLKVTDPLVVDKHDPQKEYLY